jgi:hypothetical protein
MDLGRKRQPPRPRREVFANPRVRRQTGCAPSQRSRRASHLFALTLAQPATSRPISIRIRVTQRRRVMDTHGTSDARATLSNPASTLLVCPGGRRGREDSAACLTTVCDHDGIAQRYRAICSGFLAKPAFRADAQTSRTRHHRRKTLGARAGHGPAPTAALRAQPAARTILPRRWAAWLSASAAAASSRRYGAVDRRLLELGDYAGDVFERIGTGYGYVAGLARR